MSEIAELRKIFQDLLAPDLKAIAAEVKALRVSMDERFENFEKIAQLRHDLLMAKLDLDKRVTRIEEREPHVQ